MTQSFAANKDVVRQYCVVCHNDSMLRGNMSLEHFDVAAPEDNAELAEKMIRKLRTGMMPPPGALRPAGDTLVTLVEALERRIDVVAADHPNPGGRTFQRLNRAEYAASVRDLLGLDIDAGAFLPLDTKSENFDNIADVTAVSRRGQTTVDMANGPQQRVRPFPETIQLLESLGALNNHDCRSC